MYVTDIQFFWAHFNPEVKSITVVSEMEDPVLCDHLSYVTDCFGTDGFVMLNDRYNRPPV